MEMPNSIKQFEMLSLGSLVLGVIQSSLMQNAIGLNESAIGIGASIFSFLVLLIVGGLILLTSRKKSVAGKWVLTVFFVLGIVTFIPTLAFLTDNTLMAAISAAQFGMQAFGIYALFNPESKQWFASKNSATDDAK